MAATLTSVLDYRYRHAKATVLVSNFPPDRLARHLAPEEERVAAERLIDRILEIATWIKFAGASLRKKKLPWWEDVDIFPTVPPMSDYDRAAAEADEINQGNSEVSSEKGWPEVSR